MSVQIVVTGNSVKDVANRMRELADEMWTPKKLSAVTEEDEDESEEDEEEDDDSDAEVEEESEEDDEEESETEDDVEEAPKKAAKGKAKKLTTSDVNDACKKLASSIGGKEGRKKVLSILKKKFKTESVSELKPDQYAKCIEAMADAE